MMERLLAHRPTISTRIMTGQAPNGDQLQIDNSHLDLISTGGLIMIPDPITSIGGVVSIKSAFMQVDRPYGFVLGDVPLVIVKRADGAADVYTTPAP